MQFQDIISFHSEIDGNYVVSVLYPENPRYSDLMGIIGENIAVLAIGKNLILVDGISLEDLTEDQFKAVQAHEICHGILGHKQGSSENEEIEADLTAIDLLMTIGEIESAKALNKRLLDQRGISYSKKNLGSMLSERSYNLYRNYLRNIS
jgi:hypothetical protein